MTQEIKYASLSPLQQRKAKQKEKIIFEFLKMKKAFEREGENASTESICRILSSRYGKSNMTLRRYLQAAGAI